MQHKLFGTIESSSYVTRPGAYLVPICNGKIAIVETPKGLFFLGGGIEGEESDEECIVRECLEEAGWRVRVHERMCSAEAYVRHPRLKFFHPVQYYYTGELLEKVQEPVENDHKLIWAEYGDIKGRMFSEMQDWALDLIWKRHLSDVESVKDLHNAKTMTDVNEVNEMTKQGKNVDGGIAAIKDATLEYYNSNAAEFSASTIDADMSDARGRFLKWVPQGGRILDFGCGTGRDAKAFMDGRYAVEATDGSEELCKVAAELLGKPVKCMLFQELDERQCYDGIWACASILHLRKAELPGVLEKMAEALKPGGAAYVSFKYGDFEGERNGRYFTDLTEETLAALLPEGVRVVEQWVSMDVRPGRENEGWINAIFKKG